MSKDRKSKKLITEQISREEAEQLFSDYAQASAKKKKIEAEMEIKISKIREKYQDEISELNEIKEEKFERLQHFATTNPDLFVKKKSLEFTHGDIGFRTTPPSLKTLKGYTWAAATNLLKQFMPTYVRVEESAAKDKLLADREDEEVKAKLNKCGIYVAHDEIFSVNLKIETVQQ